MTFYECIPSTAFAEHKCQALVPGAGKARLNSTGSLLSWSHGEVAGKDDSTDSTVIALGQ